MQEIHHHRVKPLLNRTLCLQNVSKYNDFLVKRPKTNFKFLKKIDLFLSSDESYRKIQTKLYKALKLLKSVRKLDLSELGVRDSSISQAKFLSIFKGVCKAEVILMKRAMDPNQLENGYIEKWLRYLPRILHLNWGLVVFGTKRDVMDFIDHQRHILNPLKYLHYCPRIQSLRIDSTEATSVFFQKALKINRYPPRLRHLDAKAQLNGEQLNLSSAHVKQLKSIGFSFDPAVQNLDSTISTINSLSKMTDIQEIDLQFLNFLTPGIDMVFTTLSQERKLNRLKLTFDFEMPDFSENFRSLKACPLKHFSIQTYYINDKNVLRAISDFVKDMVLLESLQITLINPTSFKETDPLKSLCQSLSKLQKLRHLELFFPSDNDRIKDYVVEPHDISLKHLKLETFSLHCTQIDSPRPLSYFLAQLGNSHNSLLKLTLDLGNHFPNDQSNGEILNFIERLENIQELKLPRLDFSSIKFLNQVAQTVQPLKYLGSFQLGKISNELPPAESAKAFERILSKKGLKEFCCLLDLSFLGKMQGSFEVSMKRIMRINPSLESISLTSAGFTILALKQILNWA